MSSKKSRNKESVEVDANAEDISDAVAGGDDSAAAVPPATDVSPPRKSGTLAIALPALLLAAVALVAVAFNYQRDRNTAGTAANSNSQLQALNATTSATQDALASLEQTISTLSAREAENSAALQAFGRTLDNRLRQLDSLPGRLTTVESTLSSLQGISTGARDAWLLAEAEYYMQIGNAQLQLAANPQLAQIALTHADERIRQLADPRLTNIRQALSDEIRALEVMVKPDIAGITLRLASLAGIVESLPLEQETVAGEAAQDEIDAELSGVDRALASLRHAVSGVVSVRRADEAMKPLVAPEAQYFLRANLALQLQAARLAILRGEEAVFRQGLDDADAWLAEYYVASSPAVQSARKTIAEIRGSVFSVSLPDISLSLRLLRQFHALADATDSPRPAEPPVPVESPSPNESPDEEIAEPPQ